MNEEDMGPTPTVLILSTDCVLHAFYFVNADHPEAYPTLTAPVPLPSPASTYLHLIVFIVVDCLKEFTSIKRQEERHCMLGVLLHMHCIARSCCDFACLLIVIYHYYPNLQSRRLHLSV